MTQRYYSEDPIQASRVTLAGSEAHHLLHVMRREEGQRVVLFDGSGRDFIARIAARSRSTVELEILSSQPIDRELPCQLTLGIALPKGDRQRWLVEKATELGVSQIVPLCTDRSVAQPTPSALRRLERTVIETSKQCGRSRLLEIAPPRQWPEFVAAADRCARRLIAHPTAVPCDGSSPELKLPPPGEQVVLAVGPEGGFSDDEFQAATAAGWETASLGARTLRTETAALALIAAVTLTGSATGD